MVILSLDASTQRGSVALLHGRQVTRELFPETPRGRGGALFNALEDLLRDATTIRRVVVGVGPGSYNGIRSAIATAWGIATARKIPLVGISSLLGLDDGEYFAVGDARRQQYFLAQVGRGTFITEPRLLTRDQVEAELYKAPHLPIFASTPIEFLADVILRTPSAAKLGELAANWPPNDPEPLYLKAAHITTPKRVNERP
jgi:tRNA threonylcarbamoyladenosine biosynthesis protein TsaB